MREDQGMIRCHRCLGTQYISARSKYGVVKVKCPVCKGKGIWDFLEMMTEDVPKEVVDKLISRLKKD